MLVLQRASAGSGKTFALAKNYLRYFLSIKVEEDGSRRRLRTPSELSDSLCHILAVTFTNKATSEMQQRIVGKLYDLAFPQLYRERLIKRGKNVKDPDYLRDFMAEFNVSEKALSQRCRLALEVMLNNYSDFQVSTIDSFFQLVLRTFAYESDLNDSYQIELDSKFLSRMGIDAILKDIDNDAAPEDVKFWISELMNRSRKEGEKWNIFQKRETRSTYSSFLSALGRFETEEFKQKRDQIEKYFENGEDFTGIYQDLKERYDGMPMKPFAEMQQKANELLDLIGNDEDKISNGVRPHAEKCLRCESSRMPKKTEEKFAPMQPDKFEKKTFAEVIVSNPEHFRNIRDRYLEMTQAREEWLNVIGSKEYLTWKLYSVNFPYLGLLRYSLQKRREYLKENNAVELAETNALLQKIIGNDDTPFIYERLGTRLSHFLIDEFQDTSRMQWENFYPLLSESLSRNNENLIIGDAKQSIYRFRNAEPSLITHTVAETFPSLTTKGNNPEENTNWRSDRHIVEFNNRFFKFLTEEISSDIDNSMSDTGSFQRMDFRSLYSNVEQIPHHVDPTGYVEINLVKRLSKNRTDMEESEPTRMALLAPGIIEELIGRGYRMKDIAFLVKTNEQGIDIINAFTEYNSDADQKGHQKIEFISEQSLLIGSSEAVELIVTTLATINRGVDPKIREGEERLRAGAADWNDIRCNFRLFALRNPGKDISRLLEEFYEKGTDFNAIREILADMQSTSLPALVEAIAATFIPQRLRDKDSAYLASFLDLVLEYCASHPSDIASFLKWWERKRISAAIASPEDTNAVRVMTIHKSKGLEFPCVVMLYCEADFSDDDGHAEWRWVEPSGIDFNGHIMPPFIPIDTKKNLIGTSHENLFYEFVDMKRMDQLNSLYVGFTRASNELYIYSTAPLKKGGSPLSGKLSAFVENEESEIGFRSEDVEIPETLSNIESFRRFSYGKKYENAPTLDNKKDLPENKDSTGTADDPQIVSIGTYDVRPTPDFLKYKEEKLPTHVDAEGYEEEESEDPRSTGNLFHGMMQDITSLDDLPRAARRLKIQGLVDSARAVDMAQYMHDAIMNAGIGEWFGNGFRVLNERPVLHRGIPSSRPDRIMIDKEGNVIVLDYKFGKVKNDRKYGRQVFQYVEALKSTGRFKSVKGFLWYVFLGQLVFVCD